MATREDVQSLLPATLEQLIDGTGKSETTIRKALLELTEEGLVARDDEGAYTAVAVPEPNVRERAQSRDAAVVTLLTENPGLSKTDIAEKVGVEPRLIYTTIWRLTRCDPPKIAKVRDGSRQPKYQVA